MDFWYALIGIVAFVALFPYIRCFFKRLKCAGKIKGLCRGKKHKIHATHSLWFLGSKHAKKCDLYIETASEMFAPNVAKPRIIRAANIIRRSRHHLPKANIIQKTHLCQ